MTLAAIKRRFVAGQVVTVTNHYITRTDHPCYGTRARTIARVTGSHVHFTETGSVPWPKAAQVQADGASVRFYGGGAGQSSTDLFLTITFARNDAADRARLVELENADASDPTSVEYEEWQALTARLRGPR